MMKYSCITDAEHNIHEHRDGTDTMIPTFLRSIVNSIGHCTSDEEKIRYRTGDNR